MTGLALASRQGDPETDSGRAQANVLGIVVLIAITVLALGALTAGIGTMIHSGATAADTDRIADGLASAISPDETVGVEESDVRFADGVLRAEERTVRVLAASDDEIDGGEIGDSEITVDVVETVRSDVLFYEADDRSVVVRGSAVLRIDDGSAQIHREPRIVADDESSGVLVVGAPSMDVGDIAVSTGREGTFRVRTVVEHDRIDLGAGTYQVAVETDHPQVWKRYFERQGATVLTTSAHFEGDTTDSVVAHFEGQRNAHLVVHDVDLEVQRR